MQAAFLSLFLLALLITGVLGTETRLLFFWPGCALLGLAGLMAALKWRVRVIFPPSQVCLGTVLLFVLYVTARAWTSPVQVYAREDFFILASALVTYVLVATAASHPRWRSALVMILLTLAVGNLVVGFVHFTGHWNFYVVPYFARAAGEGRIGGFFVNPNHLAAFFSFVLFLTAGWMCFGRGGAAWRLWLAFMTVSMMIGVALTVSRGGLIGLAVGGLVFAALGLWVVWQTQRHLFSKLLIAGAVIAGLGGAVLFKVNEEYLRTRMERSPMSTDVRLGIWEAALTQFQQSPVTGAGARMFYDGSVQYRSPKLPVYAEEAFFAHNEYLQLLADYGWAGAALLALVLLAHGWNGLRFLRWFVRVRFLNTGRVQSQGLAFALGSLAALAATMTHALFEFHFHVAATAITAAAILGILANPGIEGNGGRTLALPLVRPGIKLAALVAALTLLAGPWFFGRADYFAAVAQIDQSEKQTEAQIDHLSRAIAIDPRNPETLYQRGLARLETITSDKRGVNNPELLAAAEDLKAATHLNPHSYLYWLALADAQDALGQHAEAEASIRRGIARAPLHEEPRMALGLHWHRLGQFDKAEMAYLWAGQALAWNEEGTTRWIDNYRQLLTHARLMRGQPKPAAPAP